mmetsp:Transcript_2926/g.4434  ORF Transcript_2926/g.4434 Transcript_2926/m.4434 type:complete len:117 (+) Transcript_2926:32-382(+)
MITSSERCRLMPGTCITGATGWLWMVYLFLLSRGILQRKIYIWNNLMRYLEEIHEVVANIIKEMLPSIFGLVVDTELCWGTLFCCVCCCGVQDKEWDWTSIVLSLFLVEALLVTRK